MEQSYQTTTTVTFSKAKAARLAQETRRLFQKSNYQDIYAESLRMIGAKYTDKPDQIQAELLLQSMLMKRERTNMDFITNRGLLLQVDKYIDQGILQKQYDDQIIGIAHIEIDQTPLLPLPKQRFPNVTKWLRNELNPEQAERLAWHTYAI